jgi:hypothetical protein
MLIFKTMKKLSVLLFTVLFVFSGCKKLLEERSSSDLVIPQNTNDLQGVLDNYQKINRTGVSASECSSDDYYLTDIDYLAQRSDLKYIYTWEKDDVTPLGVNDWSRTYDRVYMANVVLDNMKNVVRTAGNQEDWDDIKAQALFLRSYAFWEIASAWTLAYDTNTAATDLGVPLRITSDVTEKIFRSSVKQSYERMLEDLNIAAALAKPKPVHPLRGSRPAIYALLARIYLSMRDYENCFKKADLCLQIKNNLLDFNNNPPLNPAATFPFNHTALIYNNPEIIYASRFSMPNILANARCKIDSLLYQSYQTNDLRKTVYFKNNNNKTFAFKGSLDGSQFLFNGIAVDEVYLMRAECYARKGMVTEAMTDLNTLMVKRWNKNIAYPTFTAANAADALTIILTERRKELLMRGLRWMDIKRLNKEGANITLKRVVNGQTYLLPPNDNRFALAIPKEIINISGMPQNVR